MQQCCIEFDDLQEEHKSTNSLQPDQAISGYECTLKKELKADGINIHSYPEVIRFILKNYPRRITPCKPPAFKSTYKSIPSARALRRYFKNIHYITAASELSPVGGERASAGGPVYYAYLGHSTKDNKGGASD